MFVFTMAVYPSTLAGIRILDLVPRELKPIGLGRSTTIAAAQANVLYQ